MQAPRRPRTARPAPAALSAGLLALATAASCASGNFTRETETSGTFTSSGMAFTIFAFDVPKRAIDIARENASDSRQPNMKVEEAWVVPYLGPLDWLLDVIGIRYARISGTWGFPPEVAGTPDDAR
jgi:hypothetical protein